MSARLWRAHCAELPAHRGARVELSAEESHHVRHVLRLAAGARLGVFDGRGAEWLATIVAEAGGPVTVHLDEEVGGRADPLLDLTLFQGACRGPRFEWVVEKATEIGVSTIVALGTRRSEPQAARATRIARWRRVAIESCKQCGRRRVPEIESRMELPPPDAGTLAIVLDPAEDAAPLAALESAPGPARIWVACGPEAGLAPDEVAAWSALGWKRASLGPRTLRSETAGVIAAALLLHRWADLGR